MKRFAPIREKLRSPLAQRLIVAIVLVSSAITLCLTALQMYGEYRGELEDIHAVFRQIEDVHLKSLSQSLWAANENDLKLQLEGIVRVPNLEYAAVREGGRLWAQAGQRAFRNTIERQYPMTHEYRGQTLQIGTLTVVAGLDAVYGELLNRAFIVLASNALKTFLVAGFAFAFFHWLVIRHLLSIAEFLRGLELRGPASSLLLTRAAGRRPDEIDDVATAINFMHANARSTLAALDASESRLRLAVKASNIGLWDWNIGADEVYFSPEWKRHLGYGENELPNRLEEWENRLHQEDRGPTLAAVSAILQGRQPAYEVEFRLRHKDGSYRWIYSRGEGMRDAHGKVQRFLGCNIDITERKRAEEERFALRERDRAIAQALGEIIYDWRPPTGELHWDGDYTGVLGYSAAEMGGNTDSWTSRVHPEDLERVLGEVEASTRQSRRYDLEYRFRHRDGRYVWMHDCGVLFLSPDGQLIQIIGVFRSIAERKRATEALKEREELISAFMDHFPGLISSKDLSGVVIMANRGFDVLDERGPAHFLGKSVHDLFPKDVADALWANDMAAQKVGALIQCEETVDHRDGSPHTYLTSKFPLLRNGVVFATCAISTDITERKRAEEALHEHAERVQGLSRRLIRVEETSRRNINRELHDRIGQNLSALSLNLDLIRSGLIKDSPHAVGARLDDAQNLLEATIAQVRNVMAELHPPALDDYGLFAALRTFAESFSAIVSMKVAVTGEDIVPRLSPAAEMALFRVAQGALTNAAKHSRATHIEVTLSATREKVTLTISDNGTGFDIGRSGAGRETWGLSIMRERAEAIGAVLRIESGPGQGTRVVVEVAREPA